MTKRLSPSRTFIFLAGLVALTPVRMSAAAPDPFSPDGQWEYKCVDGWWSEIHKTDTGKMVLDLSNAVEVPSIWIENWSVQVAKRPMRTEK